MNTMQAVRGMFAVAMLLVVVSGSASAVTLDELAALAKAGLGDEVLLALIESTGVDAAVDATRSIALKRAGVSDRVIAAAVRASRDPAAVPQSFSEPVAAPCDACDSNVAVIGDRAPVAVVEREVYYVPWIWVVPAAPAHPHRSGPYLSGNRGVGRFINDGTAPARGRR